ncbi:MAG TPA: response regulator [Paludibaculum sp.]|jgi:DNA-binding response OmpR family regulator
MKICFCAARESGSDAFRQRLQALNVEWADAEAVSAGDTCCDLCLLTLPSGLEDSVVLIREYRQLLAEPLPLIVCGSWADSQSVSSLLAAGADDYLPLDLETQQLGLRLHIFVQQAAQRSATTVRARLDDQLVRAQRLETLASLTGNIAHDYNNLLSAIQGNAELALMDRTLDAPVRYSLEQINSAAHRAAEITRQILAFRGGTDLKGKQPVNLSQLIREMAELLRVSIARNCSIEYRLGRTLPLVTGDPLRLRQLVMTVVTSASKGLGASGGAIQIRTDHQDEAGAARVVLEVKYTYAGLHPGWPASSSGPANSISPLAAAGVIAREHGAEITTLTDGSGGTHRVQFAAIGGPTVGQDARARIGEYRRSTGTILLVDDEESVRVDAHRLLRRAGYTVFEAATGEEGLAVMAQVASALDAVLVDLNLPGLECRELLGDMRRIRHDLRLVVWSRFPEGAATEQLAGFPDVTFIEKPTQMGELVGVLQRMLKT